MLFEHGLHHGLIGRLPPLISAHKLGGWPQQRSNPATHELVLANQGFISIEGLSPMVQNIYRIFRITDLFGIPPGERIGVGFPPLILLSIFIHWNPGFITWHSQLSKLLEISRPGLFTRFNPGFDKEEIRLVMCGSRMRKSHFRKATGAACKKTI